MRTARRLAYTSALLFVALACADRIAAPGACPEFCLPQAITVTDLLLEANRRPIHGIADLAEVLERAEDGTLLLVQRGDSTVFVVIDRTG